MNEDIHQETGHQAFTVIAGGAHVPRAYARHITLDFTLIDNNRLPRNPTQDEFEVLQNLFPSQTGVAVFGPFLTVYVDELPPKPWPVSVAGLPLFLTTNVFDTPWTIGTPGNTRYHVLGHLDARDNSSRSLYEAVIGFFEGEKVEVLEVVWIVGCWRVRVPTGTDISTLPGKVCQTTTFYISGDETTPIEAAIRTKSPTKVLFDDSEYAPIRPGVMVASNSLLTTSGILG